MYTTMRKQGQRWKQVIYALNRKMYITKYHEWFKLTRAFETIFQDKEVQNSFDSIESFLVRYYLKENYNIIDILCTTSVYVSSKKPLELTTPHT